MVTVGKVKSENYFNNISYLTQCIQNIIILVYHAYLKANGDISVLFLGIQNLIIQHVLYFKLKAHLRSDRLHCKHWRAMCSCVLCNWTVQAHTLCA